MSAHADTPLDVAVVDADQVLQARARIIMPLAPQGGDFPTETLVMEKALTAGEQKLYFYVDTNDDNRIQGTKDAIVEHIWIKTLDPDGSGSFVHSTMFQFFTEQDFTKLNGDVVLELPMPLGADLSNAAKRCFSDALAKEFTDALEVKIYLESEDRQVGYFKMHKGNTPPLGGEWRLRGIVDAGNQYRFEVLLDGEVETTLMRMAPTMGDPIELVVQTKDWFPVTVDLLACRNL
jgi:hypothetical protein